MPLHYHRHAHLGLSLCSMMGKSTNFSILLHYVNDVVHLFAELCPHIDDCMNEVVSTEEDVEIGRCVTKHLHIECTHAWEVI